MKIVKATVLLVDGADKVTLTTKLPCPFVQAYAPEQTPLMLEFHATINTGVDYCRNILGIEPDIIDARGGRYERVKFTC
jgi:hypothetical protein